MTVLVTKLYLFSVFRKPNFDYKCIVNSREMILVQLLDAIVSDKIKGIPDLYHYLSIYHVYKSTFFTMGCHISVTMAICSNKLFFKLN